MRQYFEIDKTSHFGIKDQRFLLKHLPFNRRVDILEVGNYTGCSTRFFHRNTPNGSTIDTVDIKDWDIGIEHPTIKKYICSSLYFVPKKIYDFVYLDGNHDPDYVYHEILRFKPNANIIAGHDAKMVYPALERVLKDRPFDCELVVTTLCSSWVMRIES